MRLEIIHIEQHHRHHLVIAPRTIEFFAPDDDPVARPIGTPRQRISIGQFRRSCDSPGRPRVFPGRTPLFEVP